MNKIRPALASFLALLLLATSTLGLGQADYLREKKKRAAAAAGGGGGTSNCGYSPATPGSADGNNANVAFATPCTTGSDSNGYSVSAIWMYVDTSAAPPLKLGVYANSSGVPTGSAICSASIASPVFQWNSTTITGCGTLSANTTYWIADISSSNTDPLEGVDTGNCPGFAFASQFVSVGSFNLPTTWTGVATAGECVAQYIVITGL
jgi:hypothetical protein